MSSKKARENKRFYHLKKALNLVSEFQDDEIVTTQQFTHTRPLYSNPIQVYFTTNQPRKTKPKPKKKSVNPPSKDLSPVQKPPKPQNVKSAKTLPKNSPQNAETEEVIRKKYDTFCKTKLYRKSFLSLYFMKWYRKMFKKVYEKRSEATNETISTSTGPFSSISEPVPDKDHESSSFILICSDGEDEDIPEEQYKGFNRIVSTIHDDIIEDIFEDVITPKKIPKIKKNELLYRTFYLWKGKYVSQCLQRNVILDVSKFIFIARIIPSNFKQIQQKTVKKHQKPKSEKRVNVGEQTIKKLSKKPLSISEQRENYLQIPKEEEVQTQTDIIEFDNHPYIPPHQNHQPVTNFDYSQNRPQHYSKRPKLIQNQYEAQIDEFLNDLPKRPKLINQHEEEEDSFSYPTERNRRKLINQKLLQEKKSEDESEQYTDDLLSDSFKYSNQNTPAKEKTKDEEIRKIDQKVEHDQKKLKQIQQQLQVQQQQKEEEDRQILQMQQDLEQQKKEHQERMQKELQVKQQQNDSQISDDLFLTDSDKTEEKPPINNENDFIEEEEGSDNSLTQTAIDKSNTIDNNIEEDQNSNDNEIEIDILDTTTLNKPEPEEENDNSTKQTSVNESNKINDVEDQNSNDNEIEIDSPTLNKSEVEENDNSMTIANQSNKIEPIINNEDDIQIELFEEDENETNVSEHPVDLRDSTNLNKSNDDQDSIKQLENIDEEDMPKDIISDSEGQETSQIKQDTRDIKQEDDFVEFNSSDMGFEQEESKNNNEPVNTQEPNDKDDEEDIQIESDKSDSNDNNQQAPNNEDEDIRVENDIEMVVGEDDDQDMNDVEIDVVDDDDFIDDNEDSKEKELLITNEQTDQPKEEDHKEETDDDDSFEADFENEVVHKTEESKKSDSDDSQNDQQDVQISQDDSDSIGEIPIDDSPSENEDQPIEKEKQPQNSPKDFSSDEFASDTDSDDEQPSKETPPPPVETKKEIPEPQVLSQPYISNRPPSRSFSQGNSLFNRPITGSALKPAAPSLLSGGLNRNAVSPLSTGLNRTTTSTPNQVPANPPQPSVSNSTNTITHTPPLSFLRQSPATISSMNSSNSGNKSVLRDFVEKFFTPEVYQDIKTKKEKSSFYPTVEIPSTVKPPWRFTAEYCDIIVDAINEMIDNTDLTNIDYNTFNDKYEAMMNIRDEPQDPKKKTKFPQEIIQIEQEECDMQQVVLLMKVSDLLLSKNLKRCLSS